MSSDVSTTPVIVDGESVQRVAEPESVDELREVMAEIGRDNLHAVVVGGGTRLAFGNVGGPFDLALSTRRLNHVISYEPDDLTLAVEPGCTLAQIHELLAPQQQQMALDAAHQDRSTIGGAYATGMSGPRRMSGGSLKDWVIGVEVIDAGGSIAKAGGMVVKNVTGFDMMHVHYGALGAFGVVARVNMKVFPTPGASRCLRFTFDQPDEAHAAGVALLRSQLQPGSLLVSNSDGWTLTVRIDAPESAIDLLSNRVRDAVFAVAHPREDQLSNDGADGALPFVTVVDLAAGRGVVRLPVTASRQAALLRQLSGDSLQICADLGSGLVYVAGDATADWLQAVTPPGVAPTCLALPAEYKRGLDVFGPTPKPVAEVVRRLKGAFDPDGRINRGRFVLGL